MFKWEKPKPSLCDNCKSSYFLEGGSVGITSLNSPTKNYRQRYCPKPPQGEEGKPRGRAIHMGGYDECKYYIPPY